MSIFLILFFSNSKSINSLKSTFSNTFISAIRFWPKYNDSNFLKLTFSNISIFLFYF